MIASLILAAAVAAAPNTAQEDHVPQLSELKPIDPRVESVQHVAAINVGGAIPKADFERIVPFVAKRLIFNIWPGSLDKSLLPDLLKDEAVLRKTLGAKAVVAVFLEDSDEPYPYLAVPGQWCRVNVRHLKVDKPNAQTLCDRYAKAFLRGLAYAAGAGAALDIRGVTSVNVHNVRDLDNTFITITPETYMPMHENLRTMGGMGVLIAPGSEEAE